MSAFKMLAVRTEDLPLAVAVWSDSCRQVRALQLLACPFGAVASVNAWHRFGAAIQQILATLFRIAYARYVDDLFGVDAVLKNCSGSDGPEVLAGPAGTVGLARWVINDLLGWQLDGGKAVTNAESFTALGVDVGFQSGDQLVDLPYY